MAEVGQVIELKGEYISVKLQRHDACDHCNACSAGVETAEMVLEAENLCKANVGDLVEISLEESNFLLAVIIMYIIPLISLLFGVGIGYLAGAAIGINEEVSALVVGFILLGISYFIIRRNEAKFNTRKFRPIASQIVKRDEVSGE